MNFNSGKWEKEINVRDFIVRNYTPYDGDEAFLASATSATTELWQILSDKMKIERERNGVYDIDEKTISSLVSKQLCSTCVFTS